jgi:hypothetical protein
MTTKASSLLIDTANITGVGTLTSLTVSGTITGNLSGSATTATTAGTVTTAAQPNITSVGTLTSLTINGNATLGTVANVHISGGSTGQFISTDGAGNLSFTTVSIPASPPHPFLFLGI